MNTHVPIHLIPYKMELLPKDKLNVDSTYQRTEDTCKSQRLINKIKAEYDPHRMQPLTVNRRPDGTLWIIDGQHRWLAVMQIPEVKFVECAVYELPTVKDEAHLYKHLNKDRVRMNAFSEFKSAVVAKHEPQVAINRFLDIIGLPPNSGKGYGIKCFSEVINQWNQDKTCARGALMQIRDIILADETPDEKGKQVNVNLLRALYTLARYTDGASLREKWVQKKLQNKGQVTLVKMVLKDWTSREDAAGTLLEFLNHKQRVNKLPVEKLMRAKLTGETEIDDDDDEE